MSTNTNQLWKPDAATRSAISRGQRKRKAYLDGLIRRRCPGCGINTMERDFIGDVCIDCGFSDHFEPQL